MPLPHKYAFAIKQLELLYDHNVPRFLYTNLIDKTKRTTAYTNKKRKNRVLKKITKSFEIKRLLFTGFFIYKPYCAIQYYNVNNNKKKKNEKPH